MDTAPPAATTSPTRSLSREELTADGEQLLLGAQVETIWERSLSPETQKYEATPKAATPTPPSTQEIAGTPPDLEVRSGTGGDGSTIGGAGGDPKVTETSRFFSPSRRMTSWATSRRPLRWKTKRWAPGSSSMARGVTSTGGQPSIETCTSPRSCPRESRAAMTTEGMAPWTSA